ncbi:MAG: DUF1330 domain-containing protein [Candidatus Krumholzibacteriia bacterium]
MTIERLVGLQVIDEAGYQAYREHMTPILHAHGGGFGYDFRIAEVLRSATAAPINRVFTIHFPDAAALDAFFSDPGYLAVRATYYAPSVSHATELARYER